jgi:multiple sugar transport system permease protein
MLCPVLYVVLGAFTTEDNFLNAGVLPLPNTLNLGQWAVVWQFVSGSYGVTLLRVGFYTTLTLVVGVLGGYVFSKMRFPGRRPLFFLMLSGLVMPAVLMTLPQYILMARFPFAGGNDWLGQGGHGFIGEWPVLFIYGWVPPFAIFLLKQTFDMLPSDYEDAARVDGAGLFTILLRVYGPLLRPALAALTVLTFLTYWNDYLWPSLTIMGNPDWYPIAFVLYKVYGVTTSGAFLTVLMILWPPALVFLVLQRYFVQGLVASGLKG